jgi:hypothetical protein
MKLSKTIEEVFSKMAKTSQLIAGKEQGRGKDKDKTKSVKMCYVCRSNDLLLAACKVDMKTATCNYSKMVGSHLELADQKKTKETQDKV